MQKYRLIAHPSSLPRKVSAIEVELIGDLRFDKLLIRYSMINGQDVVIPDLVRPGRANGLWRTTCFELFVKTHGGTSYVEFNASPSGQWAAYAFQRYREGMRDQPLAVAPHVEVVPDEGLCYDMAVNLSEIACGSLQIGLCAVIEETDGTKSYWALRHPAGPPDFHHPDCFAVTLAAPNMP